MALTGARVTGVIPKEAPDGTPIEIQITGEIYDDEIVDAEGNATPWLGSVYIVGDELAALPPSTPGLEDTPDDPRFQAIMAAGLAKIRPCHQAWRESVLRAPIEKPKPAAMISSLPIITPDMLPPEDA